MINTRPHKKLMVWQNAINLVVSLYKIAKELPREEEFGLKVQLRRAAVSVPANIAEGLTRRSNKDKLHFLNIANASLSEIDTHLEIIFKLDMITKQQYEQTENEIVNVQKLLCGLNRSIAG